MTHPPDERSRLLVIAGSEREDDEFVAPDSSHGVACADDRLEAARQTPQHGISGAVSADIVHVLEPVEIDDDEGEALPAALRAPQCLLDSIVEQDAVGKFGQRITQGLGARAMEAPVESEPAHAGGQADDHERGHDPIGLLLE